MKIETRQQFYELKWVMVSHTSMDGQHSSIKKAVGLDGVNLMKCVTTNVRTGRSVTHYMMDLKVYNGENALFKALGI